MLEKLKKLKDNKLLRVIGNILYVLLVIVVLLILIVVLIQRISNNNISIGGYRIFNTISESMIPKYEIGDILISKSVDPSTIKEGDDVTYKGEKTPFKGKIVTHQVISVINENGQYKFITKGLANEERDPMISSNQIYGKVVYKVKTLSFISKVINNLYAFYFLVFVPIVIILFRQFLIVRSNIKEKRREREEQRKEELINSNNKQENEIKDEHEELNTQNSTEDSKKNKKKI